MLNRAVLIGRLTRDPELRFTQSSIAVCNFTLAVDRGYKTNEGERQADFIDIIAWRQLAENCATYLAKGKMAAVDGKIQVRGYEAKDGTKRKAFEVVADSVVFLSPKNESQQASQAPQKEEYAKYYQPADTNEDLPF